MIVHVMQRAMEADIGPVLVACDAEEIATAVRDAGGEAVLTSPAHPSGSDRVWEAVQKYDPEGNHLTIINLQGDVPTLEPRLLTALLVPLAQPSVDIATLVTPITRPEEHTNPAVVKAVLSMPEGASVARALYFTRAAAPHGEGPRYHHIGVYAYRRDVLQRFVALPQSPLELREKLEQLRAIENGMRIDAAVVDTQPLGVDTPEDLARARQLLSC